MRFRRVIVTLAILILLLTGLPAVPAAAQGEACFAETRQCIRGRFLAYWQQNGGLARNGFPLTEERRETLEDGREYTVQYFERVRLEYHPENAPPYDVLLGQFGRYVSPVPVPDPLPAIDGRFLAYWEANGGLAQFGFPLSEVVAERLEDGATYEVQYFERARFEWHPEHAGTPYAVLLGQFGRRILVENELLASDPGFARLYRGDARARATLGAPTGTTVRGQDAYQAFERGALLYQSYSGVQGLISVLCGGVESGRLILGPGGGLAFGDTWRQGEPVGGGPGPGPGLYEPRFGFGKLWRENPQVRDCLGYAVTPEETSYAGRSQGFQRGSLVAATTPTGRVIYAIYRAFGSFEDARYDRYPDPSP